jgi:microcompartment protein CcmL/EutN
MNSLCLGEVEVVGLVAAIEAADVAVKTANVELLGYELAGGGGMVSVKVKGQVGAVRAAITAAAEAASKINKVVSTQIIARPSEQIEPMVVSDETVGIGGYFPNPYGDAPVVAKSVSEVDGDPATSRRMTSGGKPTMTSKEPETAEPAAEPVVEAVVAEPVVETVVAEPTQAEPEAELEPAPDVAPETAKETPKAPRKPAAKRTPRSKK